MAALLCLRKITHGFGGPSLLQDATLMIDKGDKLCLLGRNGTGKSTLMSLIAGQIEPDHGSIEKSPGISISLLSQDFPTTLKQSILEMLEEAAGDMPQHRLLRMLVELQLDPDICFSELSGGLKRRALLAKSLVQSPDILLLDEPTNHLDIESIQWLETFLKQYNGTFILVTHDRALMQAVGERFVEIDRGALVSWHGDYQGFLAHKEHVSNSADKANQLFDKKLAQEEVWIRQGIKARRTRNEGRVRALEKMRDTFQQRRRQVSTVNLREQSVEDSGKTVFVAENITFSYGDTPVISDFSSIVLRGEKIGILGKNGVGKSTLIKLLLQQLKPTSGAISQGTRLDIAYFDQHRQQLDDEKTLFDNVCEGSDYVMIGDRRTHIMSYLQDFLFSPERVRTPIKAFSGGERNRVMLAKLFMKPSNLMILDEPTNDLDIETLELLEEQLMNYAGTVLLISHDREFINHIVTRSWVFEGQGEIIDYAGGYDDVLLQRKNNLAEGQAAGQAAVGSTSLEKSRAKPVMTHQERKERAKLPRMIEKWEAEQAEKQKTVSSPQLYQENPALFHKITAELAQLQSKLDMAYARWEVLEAL